MCIEWNYRCFPHRPGKVNDDMKPKNNKEDSWPKTPSFHSFISKDHPIFIYINPIRHIITMFICIRRQPAASVKCDPNKIPMCHQSVDMYKHVRSMLQLKS